MTDYSSLRPVLVSVLINNYNYGAYIQYCLDSVYNQTYKHIEVIVYDDGSTDDSLEVLKRNGEKIKVIARPNHGKYPSFNQANGISEAFKVSSGEIVCLLDSDDAFAPEKVERVVAAFRQQPACVMVQHNMYRIDVENRPTGHIGKKNFIIDKRPLSGIYFTRRIDPFFVQTSGLSFSRTFLEKALPLQEDVYELIWADVRLSRHALFAGPICTLKDLLTEYRIHSANDSSKLDDPVYFNKFRKQHYAYFNEQARRYNMPGLRQIPNGLSKVRLALYMFFGKHSIKERIRFFKTFFSGKAML